VCLRLGLADERGARRLRDGSESSYATFAERRAMEDKPKPAALKLEEDTSARVRKKITFVPGLTLGDQAEREREGSRYREILRSVMSLSNGKY